MGIPGIAKSMVKKQKVYLKFEVKSDGLQYMYKAGFFSFESFFPFDENKEVTSSASEIQEAI